ncbi:lipase family alpha/beta hydrolase [Acanthopleuribacter pedis]|uniref:Alpha/beta fold hydrolase n=1 Tax=Acanthopleuribacter pedis TaxID=442870 RepID=A0A8J7Q5Q5_9BACT|nr:alpha/beta fold hydrolase [Acanthopleuribacter pedis]MBO1318481.1 alpha/beta fold hydrolase [Acanthopleuribacter pedis]
MSQDAFFEKKPIEAPGTWAPLAELLVPIDVIGGLASWCCPKRDSLGNGQRVLLLPGFGAGPNAMTALKSVANGLGFDARDWGLGQNNGKVPHLLPAFVDILKAAAEESGRPVVLVGWSLGGYIAREAARDNPDLVAHIITLGTPVWGGPKYTTISRFYRDKGVDVDQIEADTIERYRTPLTTPVTAYYTESDGIVSPQACIDHWSPNVTHVKVTCTHLGMTFSRQVLRGVTVTLRQRWPAD